MNEDLRRELLAMAARDRQTLEELAADGSLFAGYHPRMQEVHTDNARRLREIVSATGWPGRSHVGDDGATAAWLIVQHAIGEPGFLRAMLPLILAAVQQGEADPRGAAMLEDRIRSLEGRLQKYGTRFDWDDNGEMSPCPNVEDPDNVDALRAFIGLPPLQLDIERRRAAVKKSGEPVPRDVNERRATIEAWLKKVGWRSYGFGKRSTIGSMTRPDSRST